MTLKTLVNILILIVAAVSLPSETLADNHAMDKKDKPVEADLTVELSNKDPFSFVCEVDIHYTWRAAPPKKKMNDRRKKMMKEMPLNEVYYRTAGTSGKVGLDVKNRLLSQLPAIKAEATQHCIKTHQDKSGCIARGLNSGTTTYQELDFLARKAMLDAVVEDCTAVSGTCGSTVAKDVYCYINRPPNEPLPPKEDEGADKGKKKKKKK